MTDQKDTRVDAMGDSIDSPTAASNEVVRALVQTVIGEMRYLLHAVEWAALTHKVAPNLSAHYVEDWATRLDAALREPAAADAEDACECVYGRVCWLE